MTKLLEADVAIHGLGARGEGVGRLASGQVIFVEQALPGDLVRVRLLAKRKQVQMEPAQLAMLLDGIDLNARRLARWEPEGIDKRAEI